ncbi:MAG: rhomboid family intramembrane serine protease [Bacteroidota bacterium]|nr:rhomboid family intramembrane serine protease [Bacteroidota bacterium]MDP4274119.1 rhomboid family intramembrane serine protease [Bacteroidota bacterium]
MANFRTGNLYGNTPPVVKNLIIINTIMLLVTYVYQSTFGQDLNEILGLYSFQSPNFRIYQLITHMFMHGGFAHLFFNMFALWMFGRVLEQVWGSKRFLSFYLIVGLGAALFYMLVNYLQLAPMIKDAHAFANTPSPDLFAAFIKKHIPNPNRQVYDFIASWGNDPKSDSYISQAIAMINGAVQYKINIPTVGASGAIYGVLLAFGMLFPNTELMLLFPPIPIKAKYIVIIYFVLELYLGLTQPGSNVAHFAHLGGMLFAFILIKYWNRTSRNFY